MNIEDTQNNQKNLNKNISDGTNNSSSVETITTNNVSNIKKDDINEHTIDKINIIESKEEENKEEILDKEEFIKEKDKIKLQVIELQEEIIQWKEKFLRAKAETENIQRRAQDEIVKARKFSIENLVEQLIPVIDSLEAAQADQSNNFTKLREGVNLTVRQLTQVFERTQIISINPVVGDKFDPYLHQAIASISSEQEVNTIVSILQKGYKIFDRILRPALVTVAVSTLKS